MKTKIVLILLTITSLNSYCYLENESVYDVLSRMKSIVLESNKPTGTKFGGKISKWLLKEEEKMNRKISRYAINDSSGMVAYFDLYDGMADIFGVSKWADGKLLHPGVISQKEFLLTLAGKPNGYERTIFLTSFNNETITADCHYSNSSKVKCINISSNIGGIDSVELYRMSSRHFAGTIKVSNANGQELQYKTGMINSNWLFTEYIVDIGESDIKSPNLIEEYLKFPKAEIAEEYLISSKGNRTGNILIIDSRIDSVSINNIKVKISSYGDIEPEISNNELLSSIVDSAQRMMYSFHIEELIKEDPIIGKTFKNDDDLLKYMNRNSRNIGRITKNMIIMKGATSPFNYNDKSSLPIQTQCVDAVVYNEVSQICLLKTFIRKRKYIETCE